MNTSVILIYVDQWFPDEAAVNLTEDKDNHFTPFNIYDHHINIEYIVIGIRVFY